MVSLKRLACPLFSKIPRRALVFCLLAVALILSARPAGAAFLTQEITTGGGIFGVSYQSLVVDSDVVHFAFKSVGHDLLHAHGTAVGGFVCDQ